MQLISLHDPPAHRIFKSRCRVRTGAESLPAHHARIVDAGHHLFRSGDLHRAGQHRGNDETARNDGVRELHRLRLPNLTGARNPSRSAARQVARHSWLTALRNPHVQPACTACGIVIAPAKTSVAAARASRSTSRLQ